MLENAWNSPPKAQQQGLCECAKYLQQAYLLVLAGRLGWLTRLRLFLRPLGAAAAVCAERVPSCTSCLSKSALVTRILLCAFTCLGQSLIRRDELSEFNKAGGFKELLGGYRKHNSCLGRCQ